jgi:EF-hand domain pair
VDWGISRVVVIERTDHYVFVLDEADVLREIRSFVQELFALGQANMAHQNLSNGSAARDRALVQSALSKPTVDCTTMKLRSRRSESGNAGAIMATLTETDISESREAFDSCDRNGDGFIDPAEFRALLEELDGDVSSAECQLNFEVADTEGDGYIGFKEFVVWWTN